MPKRKLTDIRQVGRPKVYVDRTKRKFKGGEFDLYGEYKTKEEARKIAKDLRKDKTKMVRVVRDYYWTDNTTYYVYTSPYETRYGQIDFFNNLFEPNETQWH